MSDDYTEVTPDGIVVNRHGYPVDRTGLDAWSLHLKRLRDEKELKEKALNRPYLRPHEITVQPHEIPLDNLSKRTTVGKLAHLAHDHGWGIKIRESTVRHPDRWVKESIVEGKEENWQWVNSVSPDQKHYLSASKELLMLDGWPIDSVEEMKIGIVEWGSGS